MMGIDNDITNNQSSGDMRKDLIKKVADALEKKSDEAYLSATIDVKNIVNTIIDLIEKNPSQMIKNKPSENIEKIASVNKFAEYLRPKSPKEGSRLTHEHPMHNDMILKHFLTRCPVQTLMNCRLTCKKWRDLSLNTWRKSATLKLTPTNFKSRAREVLQMTAKPFQRYQLPAFQDGSPSFHLFQQIVDKYSPLITLIGIEMNSQLIAPLLEMVFSRLSKLQELVLRISYFSSMDMDGIEVMELSEKPTLRHLTLNFCYGTYHAPRPDPLLNKILEKTLNLETLAVKWNYLSSDDDELQEMEATKKVFTVINRLRVEGNYTTFALKELDIFQPCNTFVTEFPQPVAEAIIANRFELKRLSIDFGCYTNASVVLSLLEAHSTTLERLHAVRQRNTFLCQKEKYLAPFLEMKLRMPELKEMELVYGLAWGFHLLGSLDTPKLEKVVISYGNRRLDGKEMSRRRTEVGVDGDVNFEELPILLENISLSTLNQFQYQGGKHFSPEELKCLAKAMPSLKFLEINLCAETFPVVCELWPGLWKLIISNPEGDHPLLDDFAITGIPKDMDYHDGVGVSSISRKPNITNLHDLTEFTYRNNAKYFDYVKNPTRRFEVKVTERSILHGFLQLPRLNYLSVTIDMLTPMAKLALERNIPNLDVKNSLY